MSKFESQKLVYTYYQCPEFAVTTHFERSFLTLTLKIITCVMTILLVAPWSRFDRQLDWNLVLAWSKFQYPIHCRWGPDWELVPQLQSLIANLRYTAPLWGISNSMIDCSSKSPWTIKTTSKLVGIFHARYHAHYLDYAHELIGYT